MIKKIKSSLGAKLFLLLFVLAILLILGVYQVGKRNAINEVNYYYRKTGVILSIYASECVGDYLSGQLNGKASIRQLGQELQSLCTEHIIDTAYITVRDQTNSEKGVVVLSVNSDEVNIIGIDDYYCEYELDTSEMEVLNMGDDSLFFPYEISSGKAMFYATAFNYCDPNDGQTYRAMMEFSIKDKYYRIMINRVIDNILLVVIAFLVAFFLLSHLFLRNMLIKPLKKISDRMNRYIAEDPMKFQPISVKGSDERARIATAFNTMALDIQTFIMSEREYEGEKQKHLAELSIAAQIQRGLLPEERFSNDCFKVSSIMKPAKNVGGDFYYYASVRRHRLSFVIADVSGKGISAALFMASALSTIRFQSAFHESPAAALKAVNNDLCKGNAENLFVTIFLGTIDADQCTLTYANAGHNPPYLLGNDLQRLDQSKGILAGLFPDEEYEDCVVPFHEGDSILLFTDGVTEGIGADRSFFGEERFEAILREYCTDHQSTDILSRIMAQHKEFTDGVVQNDDITLMHVELKADRLEYDFEKQKGIDDVKSVETAEITLSAKKESISELKRFILENPLVDEEFRKKIYLAAEEIFVNVYSYGYSGREAGSVGLVLKKAGKTLTMTITDDGDPFDPLQEVTDPDFYDPDVEIGGLGRLLAFTIMDDVQYTYHDGKNKLTLLKYFGG